jgi:hypothetical protein
LAYRRKSAPADLDIPILGQLAPVEFALSDLSNRVRCE